MTLQPPILLAAFASPAYLWGLGAASVPIIIHLLNRRKFREMHWAAMRFLLAAIRKNRDGSGSSNGCSWRSGR